MAYNRLCTAEPFPRFFQYPPSTPELNYCKNIIYDVLDHFGHGDKIKSLAWKDGISTDSIWHYFPVVILNRLVYLSEQLDIEELLTEIRTILARKWSKEETG